METIHTAPLSYQEMNIFGQRTHMELHPYRSGLIGGYCSYKLLTIFHSLLWEGDVCVCVWQIHSICFWSHSIFAILWLDARKLGNFSSSLIVSPQPWNRLALAGCEHKHKILTQTELLGSEYLLKDRLFHVLIWFPCAEAKSNRRSLGSYKRIIMMMIYSMYWAFTRLQALCQALHRQLNT